MKTKAEIKRVALYARVSTLNHKQDTEVQLRELREYAERCGWAPIEYVDKGVSGSKDSRPELDKLMADANRRKFDAVCVWRFDRFARSTTHLLRALEAFQSLGIHFVSLQEAIDTSTPTGKMVFTVLGAVAELERSLVVERVRAGLRNAKAKGTILGRRTKEIDMAELQRRHLAGESIRTIAAAMEISIGLVVKRLKLANTAKIA
jgi:DNA invertase Pin-like site-specific DNA recombinase